jgi:5,10-methylenetetrahydromethanopterin reductase
MERSPVDFGTGIASGVQGWKVAVRAEALGFTHAWFYDTQMLKTAFTSR